MKKDNLSKKDETMIFAISATLMLYVDRIYSMASVNKDDAMIYVNDEDVVDVVEVLKNDYGEVSIKQTDDHLILFYRLNESTQERRFLFQLHAKDAAENNLLTSYTSQEYQEYTDEKQQKYMDVRQIKGETLCQRQSL